MPNQYRSGDKFHDISAIDSRLSDLEQEKQRSISRINTLFAPPLIYSPPNSTGAEPSSTLANRHELAFQPAKTDHITGPDGLIPPLHRRQAKPHPCHTTRRSLTGYELLEWPSQTDRVAAAHGSVAG